MTYYNFQQKIVLILSFLILNNYLLLSLFSPNILIKLNFLFFLVVVFIFYFKNPLENYFLKIFFLIIILISLGVPLYEWDPRSTWFFHAKRIFYDQSIFSVSDNYAAFSHNDYPKLAPAFASAFAIFIGFWNEVLPKISFSLMFLPPLILAHSFLQNTYYTVFLSIVLFIIGKYLFSGWTDGLVAIYFSLSVLLTYLIVISDTNFYKRNFILYFITFCFFVILTLIKNEGSALLLILFITTFLLKLFSNNFKKDINKILILSLSFLPIIIWKFFCYNTGIGFNDYVNSNVLTFLLPRISDINNYKLISYFLLLNEKFIISLIFFISSFLIFRNKKLFIFISIIASIYTLVLFFVFLSTPHDFYFQLNSTAARVIKTLSFLFAFSGLYNLSIRSIKY